MRTKELCILCCVLLGASLALAEVVSQRTDKTPVANGQLTAAQPASANGVATPVQSFRTTLQRNKGGAGGAGDGLRDVIRPGGADCPEPYLAGQDAIGNSWAIADLGWVDSGQGLVWADNFPSPRQSLLTKPVGVVSFGGVYLHIVTSSTANNCEKTHSFQICFYPDDGTGNPLLSAATCFNNLAPTLVEEEGLIDFGAEPLVQQLNITCVLPSVVNVQSAPFNGSGYISIVQDFSPLGSNPSCVFALEPSDAPEGDDTSWGWWASDPSGTIAATTDDLQWCLAEKVAGACCDDCAPGSCNNNSDEFTCAVLGGRFAPAPGTCATMVPACGAATGACCKADATCAVLTCTACDAFAGATWLGPGTVCADCCNVMCDGNDVAEGEGTCGPGYTDINGGCNDTPPLFSPILCGTTVCGTSGTYEEQTGCVGDANCDNQVNFADINAFVDAIVKGIYCDGTGFNADLTVDTPTHVGFEDINPFVDMLTQNPLPIACPTDITPAGGQFRDMDWYEITTTQPYVLTLTVNAEFPAAAWVMSVPTDCSDRETIGFGSGNPCQDVVATTVCVPAGKYYCVVAPQDFTGVECGATYKAMLTCEVCEPCVRTCDPGEIGYQVEAGVCGYDGDFNGGCGDDLDPNDDQFTDIVFTENPIGSQRYYAVICAQSFAGEEDPNQPGYVFRDLDWYRYEMDMDAEVYFTIETEIPLIMTPITADAAGNPWYCGAEGFWGFWSAHQDPCNEIGPIIDTILQGTNYIYVAPEDADGNAMFEGYPCSGGNNTYILSVNYTVPECPNTLACGDSPEIAENEPACFDGHVDAYNGGCDVASPNPMIPLPGFECQWFICGSSAAYVTGGVTVYDSDWYTFSLSAASYLCIEGLAELPINVDIWGPNPTCADALDPNDLAGKHAFDGYFSACADYDQDPIDPDPNTPAREQCAAGNYWMRVCLREGFTDITCGLNWEYYIAMTCDEACEDTK